MRRIRLGLLAAACVAAAGCLGRASLADEIPPPMFDALLPSGRLTVALEALAERATLAPGEEFRVVELGRDANTSQHLIAIRGAEIPHRHAHHDLLIVMLRGHGRLRLGAEERTVGEGSILFIPRGSVHAFRNESAGPAVAYAVYVPAFDGLDRDAAP